MGIQWGIQYLLVNIVWDTASTGIYVGTAFPGAGGDTLSLVNNVRRVRYSQIFGTKVILPS